MKTTQQIAKNFREVYFGGNWTAANLKDQLDGLSWQQATTRIQDLNTIAILVYHIHYYVRTATKVLEGGPLEGKDKYSFSHPPIQSQKDWQKFLKHIWEEAEVFATLVEALPPSKLSKPFANKKYGDYYRNLQGIVEHAHYHLGQITIIKKLLLAYKI